MSDEIYLRLREHIDRMPVAFPASPSGVELRILKRFFSPEEAEAALALSMLPEPVSRIHRRYRRGGGTFSAEKLGAVLATLADRGVVNGVEAAGRTGLRHLYGKLPFAVGLYEFQVDRLTRGFEEEAAEYMDEAFMESFTREAPRQMRTIPINESLPTPRRVGRYDSIRAVIDASPGPFALQNCICRQGRELVGESCARTDLKQTCLALEGAAVSVLAEGRGTELSREETHAYLKTAETEGLVLQAQNTRAPVFICCCCDCCCAILSRVKKLPDPGRILHSNYAVAVDAAACSGCGACLKRCPMDALRLESSDIGGRKQVVVAGERCIGCGLCLTTCPTDALSLRPRAVSDSPPATAMSMYLRMLYGRYGVLKATGLLLKAGLGFKV